MAQPFIYNPGIGSTSSVTKGYLDEQLTKYTPLSTLLFVQNQLENGIAAADGAVQYKGVWNALTNTPDLTTITPQLGDYYVVSVSGSTNLNGITDWVVSDWAVFNGSIFEKADHSDVVNSVNNLSGNIVLTTSEITEGTNLYYTDTRVYNAPTISNVIEKTDKLAIISDEGNLIGPISSRDDTGTYNAIAFDTLNSIIYAGSGSNLFSYLVSPDRLTITLVNTISTGGTYNRVRYSNGYLVTANGTQGVHIYSVTNTGIITHQSTYATGAGCNDVSITSDSNTMYCAISGLGLETVNITNKIAPVQTAIDDRGGNHNGIAIDEINNVLIAVTGTNVYAHVYSIATPTNPSFIVSISLSGLGDGVFMYPPNQTAYCMMSGAGLYILDYSIPAVTSVIANNDQGGSYSSCFVENEYLYISGGAAGIFTYNVTNPAIPAYISNFGTNSQDVYRYGNYVFSAAGGNGLEIYSIDDNMAINKLTITSLQGDALDVKGSVIVGGVLYSDSIARNTVGIMDIGVTANTTQINLASPLTSTNVNGNLNIAGDTSTTGKIDGRYVGIDGTNLDLHISSTSAHGVVGSIVGTNNVQTITNKTISADSNTISGLATSSFVLSDANGYVDGNALQKSIPAGEVVGTTDIQTLTNKTISADSNTISGLAASSFVLSDANGYVDGNALQKSIPAGEVVGTSDIQTLTNKTISTSFNTIDINANDVNFTGTTLDPSIINATSYLATNEIRDISSNGIVINNIDPSGTIVSSSTILGDLITCRRSDFYDNNIFGGSLYYNDNISSLILNTQAGIDLSIRTANSNRFILYSNGDMNMRSTIFIDESPRRIGLSTTGYFTQASLPQDDIHFHNNISSSLLMTTNSPSTTAGGRLLYTAGEFSSGTNLGGGNYSLRSDGNTRAMIYSNGDISIGPGRVFCHESTGRIGMSSSGWFSQTNFPQDHIHSHNNNSVFNAIRITASGSTTIGARMYYDSNEAEAGFGTVPSGGHLALNTEGIKRFQITAAGVFQRFNNPSPHATSLFQIHSSNSSIAAYFSSSYTGAGGDIMECRFDTILNPTSSNAFIMFKGSGTSQLGAITGDGAGGTVYSTVSDSRTKENIQNYTGDATSLLNSLQVRTYNYINDVTDTQHTGLIAQEVQPVLGPLIALGDPLGDVTENPMSLNLPGIVPYLIKCVQELSARITTLEASNNNLQTRVTTLEGYHV